MTRPLVVAVDGPAGAGKSAVSRRVAEALGVPFVDSGMFYRAVAWLALEEGVASDDVERLVELVPRLRVEAERVFSQDRDLTADIHRPEIKPIEEILYANCGDWVENCTALVEHRDGRLEILYMDREEPVENVPVESGKDFVETTA